MSSRDPGVLLRLQFNWKLEKKKKKSRNLPSQNGMENGTTLYKALSPERSRTGNIIDTK